MVLSKNDNFWLIPILGLGAVVAGVVLANRRRIGVPDPFADRQLIRKGIDKPTIWQNSQIESTKNNPKRTTKEF